MRIPLGWLKLYIKLPPTLAQLTDQLTSAGHMLDKIDQTGEETVIDLELRGNRADCYSILGIAREVSALFGYSVKEPPIYHSLPQKSQLDDCQIEIKSDYAERVTAVVVKNVKIEPSPIWLKKRLTACGIPAINNIVDLTNYVMVETGEPMHAFDLDLVKPKITIRLAQKNEKMITFEGTEIITVDDDLVWSKNDNLLSVAGAIGSRNYSIISNTKNILIEAASYNQTNIRRTCRRHNLMTEAGLRHEKDLDPNLVDQAIYRFLYLIKENNWGKIEPYIFDYYPKPRKESLVTMRFQQLDQVGGLKIKAESVKKILERLQMKVIKENQDGIAVRVPTYRTDIEEEADLIEEVLRIYGYEKIPPKILSLEIPPISTPKSVTQEDKIREVLVGLGFDEVISSSFVTQKSQAINFSLGDRDYQPVIISNPPTLDFQKMQLSLLPNLWEVTEKVIERKGELVQFFEIGKAYLKSANTYNEKGKLGLIFWRDRFSNKENFLAFKGLLEAFFQSLSLKEIEFKESNDKLFDQFAFEVFSATNRLAMGGKIPLDAFYTEIDLEQLLTQGTGTQIQLWPQWPPSIEDLTFILPPKTLIGNLINFIKSNDRLISQVVLVDNYKSAYTFRIFYQSDQKTLTSQEVRKVRQKIIRVVMKKFHAQLKQKN